MKCIWINFIKKVVGGIVAMILALVLFIAVGLAAEWVFNNESIMNFWDNTVRPCLGALLISSFPVLVLILLREAWKEAKDECEQKQLDQHPSQPCDAIGRPLFIGDTVDVYRHIDDDGYEYCITKEDQIQDGNYIHSRKVCGFRQDGWGNWSIIDENDKYEPIEGVLKA